MTQQAYLYHPAEPSETGTSDKATLAQLSMSSRTSLRREVLGRRDERAEYEQAQFSTEDAIVSVFQSVRSLFRRDRTAMTH